MRIFKEHTKIPKLAKDMKNNFKREMHNGLSLHIKCTRDLPHSQACSHLQAAPPGTQCLLIDSQRGSRGEGLHKGRLSSDQPWRPLSRQHFPLKQMPLENSMATLGDKGWWEEKPWLRCVPLVQPLSCPRRGGGSFWVRWLCLPVWKQLTARCHCTHAKPV
jgi:hypothetical protein